MRILLTGATGFLGSALVDALGRAGHDVVVGVRDVAAASRRWPGIDAVGIDYLTDHSASDWLPRLEGVDAVINAVGILSSHGSQTFEAIHVRAPCALFEACAQMRVRRVVQISALGADEDAETDYHRSKREADRCLASLDVSSSILQPSLVFSAHGPSARWFTMLATMPALALPRGGPQCLQPVHLDDVCAAVVAAVAAVAPPARVAVVGPRPLTLRSYIDALAASMGLRRRIVVPVPGWLSRAGVWLMGKVPGSIGNPDTLKMLERGNCAPADALVDLIGRPPRDPADFFEPASTAEVRRSAQLRWLLPVLRVALALMWIVTAVVSLWVYPVPDSLGLLARTGLTGTAGWISLYGAALLDLVLGVAMLWPGLRRQLVYRLQAALILGYTFAITLWLPEFWAHPYGPVLKNIPLLAAIWLLHELDRPEQRA